MALTDEPPQSERGDDASSSAASSSDDDELVETLVAGRAKRATAGNRLATLIDQEADDELQLLFEEQEDDVEFEGDEVEEGASDVDLGSSSDEEDQAGKDDDELAGEKELQKEARAQQKAQKRKAQDALFKRPVVKRAKATPAANGDVTPTTAAEQAERAKKKSERVSWIPPVEEGPTRSSSRKLTVQNKAHIHARLKEGEKKRKKQLAQMEAAAKRKDASKAKEMTQADRLAEAERTEKLNSKSLNRWEEMEKKRVEEQKARLAALHNKRLEGPFIRWWSGQAEWRDGKLGRVGRPLVEEVEEDATRTEVQMKKSRKTHEDKEDPVDKPQESEPTAEKDVVPEREIDQEATEPVAQPTSEPTAEKEPPSESAMDVDKEVPAEAIEQATPAAEPSTPKPTADVSIDDPPPSTEQVPAEPNIEPTENVEPPGNVEPTDPPAGPQVSAPEEQPASEKEPPRTADASDPIEPPKEVTKDESKGLLDGIEYYASLQNQSGPASRAQSQTPAPQPKRGQQQEPQQENIPVEDTHVAPSPPPSMPAPPQIDHSARNLVILENFDPLYIRQREVQNRILFKQRTIKPQKPPHEYCAITARPARFRDPHTGLPYHDAAAYKQLQKARAARCIWSSLLGCYVGPIAHPAAGGGVLTAARGVPERFWSWGNHPSSSAGASKEGSKEAAVGGGVKQEQVGG